MLRNALVIFETEGSIAVITLNRPEKKNAIDAQMTTEIRNAISRFQDDDSLRVCIIQGGGDIFCAGMDLKAFNEGESADILFGEGGFAGIVSAKRSKPLIAAVEGPALAGGFEIAIACDIIVASEKASFGLPEVKVGLFAGAGGSFRLPQLVPHKKAIELMLTGEIISAEKAEKFGLINHITKPGDAFFKAKEIAHRIANNSPIGVESTLLLARLSLSESETELWKLNDEKMRAISISDDAEEGTTAFLERRAPKWQNK